ncbi:hypothetical protein J31TS4_05800 [Paenibacillus sp. J31TS4]|uniref:type II secretion system F family protein n=1 Tax=Paenibacillus sp. J31TS4 TaxID=2807195 RepID=UPI001B0DF5B3|nr:type II secretion system F family protein [Paenibacillus sp. J31TS4]GIP37300.1 hypothetical protein J31TS4_05800 [Paenibacillus sp. J31TS4]
MTALTGRGSPLELTRKFGEQLVSLLLLGLLAGISLSLVSLDAVTCMTAGPGLALLLPFLELKRLEGLVKARKRRMLTELPELLSKLTLLVNAGETVQQALIRCARQGSGEADSPLYVELRVLSAELVNNVSFSKAMEDFSKRCALPEVALFTTTMLLNYRRGGEDFVHSLRELSRTVWERRKSLAKTLGEEASAKLVFPMVLIFFGVMLVVAAPAFLIMNGS